jgi:hypothetical protein
MRHLLVSLLGRTTPKDCGEPHNSEFVGVIPWDTTYERLMEELRDRDSAVDRRCVDKITEFVGARVRTGTLPWVPSRSNWNAGDRAVRCFFWLGEDKTVSRSMRGVGSAGWPLR